MGKPPAPIPHGCSLAWLHGELTGGCAPWVTRAEAVATLSSSSRAGSEKEECRLAGRSLSPPSGSGPGPCLPSLWCSRGQGTEPPGTMFLRLWGAVCPRPGRGLVGSRPGRTSLGLGLYQGPLTSSCLLSEKRPLDRSTRVCLSRSGVGNPVSGLGLQLLLRELLSAGPKWWRLWSQNPSLWPWSLMCRGREGERLDRAAL